MTPGDSAVTFNVSGSQQGNINMVGGDMHVGSQTNVALDVDAMRRDVSAVRQGLDAAGLPAPARQVAEAELASAERELAAQSPNREVLVDRLTKFTTVVKSFGGLVAAGTILVDPLTRLASHLGPLGNALQRLLG